MATVGISASIDVSKIDKTKLIKGKKGTYLNITAFVDIDNKDQYDNNGMITQSVTSEERESGAKGAILGNTKVFWQGESKAPAKNNLPESLYGKSNQSAPVQDIADMKDDVPF